MAISASDRQRKRSARLREMGMHRTSVILSEKAYATLRQIAEKHDVTQSQAIELGVLAAARWLAEGSDDA
ncbi:Uncharacterised protein [Klebsiella variicola]|nr:Uncharacterised protein [Klebsiella variicola]